MSHQTVVVVEDDEILSKVIVEELSESGFKVSHASDGEAGLKMIKEKKPDLVLLDVIMPKKTGFDVLEELKVSPTTSAMPVIMLTMLGKDEDIKKGLKMGANDYIVKSQHPVGEIVDKVKKFFKNQSHPEGEKKK